MAEGIVNQQQGDFCDEDVTAAIKELKLSLSITADDLRNIWVFAQRHAQSRVASKMCVRHAMTKGVMAVSKFDDITHALKILAEKSVSGLPVVDRENKVVGIISEADVVSMVSSRRAHTFGEYVRHLFGNPLPERKMGSLVGDIMTSPAVTTTADVEVSEAVRLMDHRRIRRLPVVDKGGRLVGIISRSDIIKAIQQFGENIPED